MIIILFCGDEDSFGTVIKTVQGYDNDSFSSLLFFLVVLVLLLLKGGENSRTTKGGLRSAAEDAYST
jgi:hypothetical protein